MRSPPDRRGLPFHLNGRPRIGLGGPASVGAAYKEAVRAFYDAGCRHLQLDDISFAYLCDPEQQEMSRARGDDPERQPEIYAGMVREALRDKPADLAVTMHLCRGNFRSTFTASTQEGNTLAEEEQWAKLRMIVETAGAVWGGSDGVP